MEELNLTPDVKRVVAKVRGRERISREDAEILWMQAPLALLGMLAVELKREKSGEVVFYNRNIHVEPTNVCVFNCRFCSYHKAVESPMAWDYSLDKVREIVSGYVGKEITEVHIVGGVHPKHDLWHYIDMVRLVKEVLPYVAVKAFTAIELGYMIRKAGLTLEEGLSLLKDAGMEAIPGGGAEIFAPDIRSQICPDKGTAEEWLAVHREAHKLGIPTNSTILYGHIESVAHRIDHLDRLRKLQDETGGFNAFIPLKYRSAGNSMSHLGEVSITEDLKMLAVSRIFLDNFPHVKAYWPMYGKTVTELALSFGADDIDGTIDDTTKIYSMAGAEEQKPSMTVADIEKLVRAAGFEPVERDTFYNPVKRSNFTRNETKQ